MSKVLTTLAAATIAVGVITAAVSVAQQPATTAPAKPSALDLLAPYVGGEFAIDAEWANGGGKLVARQTWEWGLAKKFIVNKVFLPKPDGTEYQRYESIFSDDAGVLVAHNLDYTGKVRTTRYTVEGNAMTDTWSLKTPDGKEIAFKQTITLTDANSYHWQVWNKPPGATDHTQMMDGTWKRTK